MLLAIPFMNLASLPLRKPRAFFEENPLTSRESKMREMSLENESLRDSL